MTGPSHAEIKVCVPASPAHLKPLRDLVWTFATLCGAPEHQIDDMLLATNEACGNVVLHAYGEDEGSLRLRAWRTDDRLVFEVSDSGTPVAKPQPGRLGGLGLKLIRQICDSVEIEGPGRYGTRLEMAFDLERARSGETYGAT